MAIGLQIVLKILIRIQKCLQTNFNETFYTHNTNASNLIKMFWIFSHGLSQYIVFETIVEINKIFFFRWFRVRRNYTFVSRIQKEFSICLILKFFSIVNEITMFVNLKEPYVWWRWFFFFTFRFKSIKSMSDEWSYVFFFWSSTSNKSVGKFVSH